MDQVSQGAGLLRTMKKRAAELRAVASAAGKTTTHSAALEVVAHERGFRDWNAAAAAAKAASRNTPLFFG